MFTKIMFDYLLGGEVIRDDKPTLVLIDFGLNQYVGDSHYKRKLF